MALEFYALRFTLAFPFTSSSMAKNPERRARTGNRRRGAKRNKTRHHRNLHLTNLQVGYMQKLQRRCFFAGANSLNKLLTIFQLVFVYNYIQNNVDDDALSTLVLAVLHLSLASFANSTHIFSVCERFDYFLYDITEEEEDGIYIPPRQNIRFHSWDDQLCYDKTNFTKSQLLRIYNCFGLQTIANQNNGFIKVPTGHLNAHGRICCYNFHPEELFLYTMMRMKTGDDITQMAYVFGGSTKRWSFAWRWIMVYLDARYTNIIGHQGLLRFVDQFPAFYDAINEKVKKNWVHNVDHRNGTYITANENHLGKILERADFLQDPAKIFLLHIWREPRSQDAPKIF